MVSSTSIRRTWTVWPARGCDSRKPMPEVRWVHLRVLRSWPVNIQDILKCVATRNIGAMYQWCRWVWTRNSAVWVSIHTILNMSSCLKSWRTTDIPPVCSVSGQVVTKVRYRLPTSVALMNTTAMYANTRRICITRTSWIDTASQRVIPKLSVLHWLIISSIRNMVKAMKSVRNIQRTWFIRKLWTGLTARMASSLSSVCSPIRFLMQNWYNRKTVSFSITRKSLPRTRIGFLRTGHAITLRFMHMLSLLRW